MGVIITIAGWFGINPFRLIAYAAIAVGVTVGALAIRHHYVALGYNNALVAVAKQNDVTKSAAAKIEAKAAKCQEGVNGYWDVISQGCKLEDAN